MLDPTGIASAPVGIAVGPVQNASGFVPFVLAANPRAVIGLDRHPGGEIDVVGDEQRSSVFKGEDEALMAAALVVIRQEPPL